MRFRHCGLPYNIQHYGLWVAFLIPVVPSSLTRIPDVSFRLFQVRMYQPCYVSPPRTLNLYAVFNGHGDFADEHSGPVQTDKPKNKTKKTTKSRFFGGNKLGVLANAGYERQIKEKNKNDNESTVEVERRLCCIMHLR